MFSADFIGRPAASAPPAKLNLHAAFVLAGDDLREPTLYSVFGPNPSKPGTLHINTEYEAELALTLKYEDYDVDIVDTQIKAGGAAMLADLQGNVLSTLKSEGLDASDLPATMDFEDSSKMKLYIGKKKVRALLHCVVRLELSSLRLTLSCLQARQNWDRPKFKVVTGNSLLRFVLRRVAHNPGADGAGQRELRLLPPAGRRLR